MKRTMDKKQDVIIAWSIPVAQASSIMANDPFLKDSKISVNSEIQYDQQDLSQAKRAIVTKYEIKKKPVTNICTHHHLQMKTFVQH